LLKFAVIFLNYGEKELEKFGYRIILSYSNLFNDYVPLYDISINKTDFPYDVGATIIKLSVFFENSCNLFCPAEK
jgi:hypothetical protein